MAEGTVRHAPLSPEPHADLTHCDREPIQYSSAIQPEGSLLVIDPRTGAVIQSAVASRGARLNTDDAGVTLAADLTAVCGDLQSRLPESGSVYLGAARDEGDTFHVIGHRAGPAFVVELEAAPAGDIGGFDEVYRHLRQVLDKLQRAATVEAIAAVAAAEVRRITGLDRALVYRFDEAWNGEVVAEDRNERLPSYLGLRFPASDIPAQARELYRKNRLRLIADANYAPVPIVPALNPITNQPLDLTHSVLRSVSPVHLEYMRNMGTMASMSISLLRGDRLWGLISCHNAEPARVPFHIRNACDFVGQVMSMQIAAKEAEGLAERRHKLRVVQRRLLSAMAAAEHFIDGLTTNPDDLLALAGASGAAVVFEGACKLAGLTPPLEQVKEIVTWLAAGEKQDVLATACLARSMPGAERFKDSASGLLAVAISQLYDSFVIWFRPEVLKNVSWGGDPTKPTGPSGQIHPRKSFETWRETVRLQAIPWYDAEIDAAGELRSAIVDIVLRKAEEMAALSEKLTASNKELEAFSYSVSHDLRAPFRHIVGYAQLLKKLEAASLSEKGSRYIDTIVESAVSAGTLVDNLLSYSQMGRSTIRSVPVEVGQIVREIRQRMALEDAGRKIEWRIGELPRAMADPMMLRLVVQNLLENAVKFSRGRDPAVIEVGFDSQTQSGAYFVRDNGVGFDMAYVGKLFGVFQRLHHVGEFEGTGIGLANVKRIIGRHRGSVWAVGELNKGATIYFTLPGVEA